MDTSSNTGQMVAWMAVFFISPVFVFVYRALVTQIDARGKEMAQYAAANGYAFPRKPANFFDGYHQATIFGRGHQTKAQGSPYDSRIYDCVMTKSDAGVETVVLDFSYTSGYSKGQYHETTVCILDGGSRDSPPFTIRRQNVVSDSLGRLAGVRDIDIPGDEAFTSDYVVRSTGPAAAVVEFLDARRRRELSRLVTGSLELEVAGTTILVHRDVRFAVTGLDALIHEAREIRRALWPD